MIAATILLVIAIGVLPLFLRAINNNVQGQMSSEAVNYARSEIERLMQLNFSDPELTVPIGQTELVRTEYWVDSYDEWQSTVEHGYSPEANETTRIVTIRQFSQSALDDEELEDIEALPGIDPDAPGAAAIHFKEIVIFVTIAGRADAPGKRLTLRAFRGA